MDQTTIEDQIEFFLVNRNQRQRVDGLIEARKQPPRQRKRLILELRGVAVMDDKVHTD